MFYERERYLKPGEQVLDNAKIFLTDSIRVNGYTFKRNNSTVFHFGLPSQYVSAFKGIYLLL